MSAELAAAGNRLRELLLQPPGRWVATAESLTSGGVQALIGRISGASEFFRGGLTAYSLAQKTRHLGVDGPAAEQVNSVSAAVAEQMALGACRLFDADFGVGTTGYAEPSARFAVDVPFAYWAVTYRSALPPLTRSARIECAGGSRVDVQQKVALAAFRGLIDLVAEVCARPA